MHSRKTLLNVGGGGGGRNKHLSTTSVDRGSFHKPPVYNELDYENEEEDDSSMDGDKEKVTIKKPKMVKKEKAEVSIA